MAQRLQPEVLIYDLGMGESLMPELLRLAHGPVLMVVVRTAGVAVLRRVLRAGATCCVGRDDNMATYESALLLVVLGRRFLGPLVEARMVDDLATCPAAALEPVEAGLSAREREIFALLGEALGTRAMAERLGLSVKTVETHLGRMKGKLGVKTRAALARQAMLAAG